VFGSTDGEGGEDGDPPDRPPAEGSLEELIAQAEAAFENAETALRSGDLATYQRWVDEAERLLEEIADVVGQTPNATGPAPLWG
jgi:hypothetical protein